MLFLWVRVICGLLWFFSMHNIFNFKGFISSNISLAMSCFRLWLCTNVVFWVCGSFVPVHFPELCYFHRKDWNSCQHQSSILCPKPVCSLVFHSEVSMGYVYLSSWIFGPEVALCRVSWWTVPPLRFFLWFSIRVRGSGLQQKHVFLLYFLWLWTMTHKTAWSHPSPFPWAL